VAADINSSPIVGTKNNPSIIMLTRLDICADINQQKYIDMATGIRTAVYD
jgi:hypothetical protein